MPTTVIIALLNGLGAVLPQLPALINELKGSANLSGDGKALLEQLAGKITEDEKAVEATSTL